MADTPSFSSFVPGFDFLQGLVNNAGAALPGIGQWVTPTLNPQEIEKRINELRTVQFWLEQNTRMLGATIQALEVQRMTLSTLQTMNVQMEDLRDTLQMKTPGKPVNAAESTAAMPATQGAGMQTPAGSASAGQPSGATAPAAPAGVDPLQWWGTLTQHFTQLASQAIKHTNVPTEAATPSPKAVSQSNKPTVEKASSKTAAIRPLATKTAAKPAATKPRLVKD